MKKIREFIYGIVLLTLLVSPNFANADNGPADSYSIEHKGKDATINLDLSRQDKAKRSLWNGSPKLSPLSNLNGDKTLSPLTAMPQSKDLLVNGSFESGQYGWYRTICPYSAYFSANASDGSHSAFLSPSIVCPDEDLRQAVYIPNDADTTIGLYFDFEYSDYTYSHSGFVNVAIDDYYTRANYVSNFIDYDDRGYTWKYGVNDITSLKGKLVVLRISFYGQEDSNGFNCLYIDNVHISELGNNFHVARNGGGGSLTIEDLSDGSYNNCNDGHCSYLTSGNFSVVANNSDPSAEFVSWSGCDSVSGSICNINVSTVNTYKEVVANYKQSLEFQTYFNSGPHSWGVENTRFVTSGDFNNDGKDDIAAMYDYGNDNMSLFVFPNTGTGFGQYKTYFYSGIHNWGVKNTRFVVSGDFNNDGRDDIAAMYDYGNNNMSLFVFPNTGSGFGQYQAYFYSGPNNWGVSQTKFITSGDFNNDGRDDIAAMYDYGNNNMSLFVFPNLNTKFGQYQAYFYSGPNNWGVSQTKFITSGDYNNDGRDDIAAMYDYGNNNMSLFVFPNTGTSFGQFQTYFNSGPNNWGVANTGFVISGDYNADGKDDIAAMYDYGNDNMGLFVFPNTGSSFSRYQSYFYSGPRNWGVRQTKFLITNNFDHDNRDNIVAMYDYGGDNMSLFAFKPTGYAYTK